MKKRKTSRRNKVSRRRKTSRRNKVSRRRKIGGGLDEDMAKNMTKVDSNTTQMIIAYIPKGSPDENEYLKNIDKTNDSRVGSFVINLNNLNQDGGATVCIEDWELAPVQTYNHILKTIHTSGPIQDEYQDYINDELEDIDVYILTGIPNSRLRSVIRGDYGEGEFPGSIYINLFEDDGDPYPKGPQIAHGTLHPQDETRAKKLNSQGPYGNIGASHIQNDATTVKTVMGVQWRMCAEYDCNEMPFQDENVRFFLQSNTILSRNPAASNSLQYILKRLMGVITNFMGDLADMNNEPYSNLDNNTREFLIARLREVCIDENLDRTNKRKVRGDPGKRNSMNSANNHKWSYVEATVFPVTPPPVADVKAGPKR